VCLDQTAETEAHRREIERGLHEGAEREPAPQARIDECFAFDDADNGRSRHDALSPSVLECATGENQEHVLETRASHEHRIGLEAFVDGRVHRRITVVGVYEHSVGEWFGAIAEPLEPGRLERGVGVEREPYLHDLARDTVGDELPGGPSATIFALSMITSRSHNCSASSM